MTAMISLGSVSLFILLTPLVVPAFADEHLEKSVASHTELTRVLNNLDEVGNAHTYCPTTSLPDDLLIKGCKWEGACSVLASKDLSPVVYKSADGGEIPNYTAAKINEAAAYCYSSLRRKGAYSGAITSFKDDTERKRAEADQSLQAYFKAHPDDEALYHRYVQYSLKLATEEKGSNSYLLRKTFIRHPSEDSISKELESFEAETKQNFSPDAKKGIRKLLWNESLLRNPKPDPKEEEEIDAKLPKYKDLQVHTLVDPTKLSTAEKAKLSERVIDLGAKMKANMLDRLHSMERSMTPAQLVVLQRSIKFVEGAQFRLSPPEECRSGPNAHITMFGEVAVCPQMAALPEMALKRALLHELGHAFDPCTMSGWAKSAQNLPFAGTLKCLANPSGTGVKGWPENVDSLSSVDFQDTACGKKFLKEGKITQINEGFADWIAYDVLGKEISHLPEAEQKAAAFEAAAGGASFECKGVSDGLKSSLKSWMKDSGCPVESSAMLDRTLLSNESESAAESRQGYAEHPSAALRYEKIAFGNDDMKKAMGCPQEKGPAACTAR